MPEFLKYFNLNYSQGSNILIFNFFGYMIGTLITAYFANIESIFVAHEIITIASNSEDTVRKLKEILINDFGATEIPKLEKVQ